MQAVYYSETEKKQVGIGEECWMIFDLSIAAYTMQSLLLRYCIVNKNLSDTLNSANPKTS